MDTVDIMVVTVAAVAVVVTVAAAVVVAAAINTRISPYFLSIYLFYPFQSCKIIS
ncbi:MAG: hypothetical protein WA364_05840 [Candidatus Nitrosopolaris sp.]